MEAILADDLHYVGGDWYFLDMYSGMKVRAAKARRQWDNVITSGTHFSPRQPQDMVQGVRDDQAVPWALPRQVNQFTVIATFVTAFAGRRSLSMQVDSAVGFQIGDRCQVPLDDGNLFTFTLSGIVGNVLSWASPGLPGTVGGSFGDPLENQVFNLGPNNSAPP
jgi:hypothetical protein